MPIRWSSYILEHPEWDPNWREDAATISNWSRAMVANPTWLKYGLVAINEQTAYRVSGNSQSARHATTRPTSPMPSGN